MTFLSIFCLQRSDHNQQSTTVFRQHSKNSIPTRWSFPKSNHRYIFLSLFGTVLCSISSPGNLWNWLNFLRGVFISPFLYFSFSFLLVLSTLSSYSFHSEMPGTYVLAKLPVTLCSHKCSSCNELRSLSGSMACSGLASWVAGDICGLVKKIKNKNKNWGELTLQAFKTLRSLQYFLSHTKENIILSRRR